MIDQMTNTVDEEAAAVIRRIGAPLHAARFWLKLLGGLMIAYGIVAALTLIGIIVAWLPLWTGVLLWQAAGSIDRAQMWGDEAALIESLHKVRTYFTIMGVMALIGLTVVVASILLGAFAGFITALNS